MQLSARELATVLAALRHWQQDLAASEEEDGPISPDHFDETIAPLTVVLPSNRPSALHRILRSCDMICLT